MKKLLVLILTLTVLLAFGCSRRSLSLYEADLGVPLARARADSFLFEENASSSDFAGEFATAGNTGRKLVRSAFIRIRVDNLEEADVFVNSLLRRLGGYSASTTVRENTHNYSLRIPSSHYDFFLTEINDLGRVLQRTETTEDVTLHYFDLEGRLETQRELLRTFQSYLSRAATMDEILSVETRIADLQREIDTTGSMFRHLTDRIDFASIDLFLLGPVAATQNRGEPFGERIERLLGGFGIFLSTVGIILLGIIIYGIPLLIIVILLFWILFGRIGLLKKLWRLVMKK